jgi:hypothetical protein
MKISIVCAGSSIVGAPYLVSLAFARGKRTLNHHTRRKTRWKNKTFLLGKSSKKGKGSTRVPALDKDEAAPTLGFFLSARANNE